MPHLLVDLVKEWLLQGSPAVPPREWRASADIPKLVEAQEAE